MKKLVPKKSKIITFLLTFILGVGFTYLILGFLFGKGYIGFSKTPDYIVVFVCGDDASCRGEICNH